MNSQSSMRAGKKWSLQPAAAFSKLTLPLELSSRKSPARVLSDEEEHRSKASKRANDHNVNSAMAESSMS